VSYLFQAEQWRHLEVTKDADKEEDPIQSSSSLGKQDPVQEFPPTTSKSAKPPMSIACLALQAIESPHPRSVFHLSFFELH
jgi:hypothetical protein